MKTPLEKQLLKIVRAAPRANGFWTGPNDDIAFALGMLIEEEARIVPQTSGFSGFVIEMPGGAAIVIMRHDALAAVDWTIRTQGQANAVLFTLIGGKFIEADRIPPGTPQRTAWGDVRAIRWFRANVESAAQIIHFDQIWPAASG